MMGRKRLPKWEEKYPVEVAITKFFKTLTKVVDWYFFYKPEDNFDRWGHIIFVLSINIVIWSLGR